MAFIKIYLPTYRRHQLLPRAIRSLREQTFADWRCEVHNDDPDDPFPGELVAGINDDRISVVNHTQRLGGAATMNAFYAPAEEAFVSILEDDNWWEPEFLKEMVVAAERNPHVTVLWANMRLWKECPDGSFAFTGKTTYPEEGSAYKEFRWPDSRQIMGAVHSNGACLIRSRMGGDYRIPDVPLAANIELFRERIFPEPLLLVRKPLANFSITMATDRSANDWSYGVAMALSTAAFFREAQWPLDRLDRVFYEGRKRNPPPTNNFLNAALIDRGSHYFFRIATFKELLRWIVGLAKRPRFLLRLLRAKKNHREWWVFLLVNSARKFSEAREACQAPSVPAQNMSSS
jgi:glycosyltransferase involved in cell wall biosynthesis